jgi:hypothetical protein
MHYAHHKGHARHADKHENKHHHWPEKHPRCWAVIAPPPHGITSIASATMMIVAAESEALTQARAAYDVAVSLYQTDEIELRQGSRVIRSSKT